MDASSPINDSLDARASIGRAQCDQSIPIEDLRAHIAAANGIELFKKYSATEAADFIGIHPQTLKRHRLQSEIAYVSIGPRTIFYFGYQISDYLIRSIKWATEHNLNSKSETTGLAANQGATLGTDTGGTLRKSAHAAHLLARATLKKPKKS